MQNSSIVTNVKITNPKKAEAFINALDEAANAPIRRRKEENLTSLQTMRR